MNILFKHFLSTYFLSEHFSRNTFEIYCKIATVSSNYISLPPSNLATSVCQVCSQDPVDQTKVRLEQNWWQQWRWQLKCSSYHDVDIWMKVEFLDALLSEHTPKMRKKLEAHNFYRPKKSWKVCKKNANCGIYTQFTPCNYVVLVILRDSHILYYSLRNIYNWKRFRMKGTCELSTKWIKPIDK